MNYVKEDTKTGYEYARQILNKSLKFVPKNPLLYNDLLLKGMVKSQSMQHNLYHMIFFLIFMIYLKTLTKHSVPFNSQEQIYNYAKKKSLDKIHIYCKHCILTRKI